MSYKFSKTSLDNLKDVHPDLVKVVKRALQISEMDFGVIEGVRTLKRQKMLKARGASRTLRSRHLTGHAVDINPFYDGKLQPNHWPPFFKLATAMKQAAKELGVKVRWGGSWKFHDIASFDGDGKALQKAYRGSFPDGAHFELSRRYYG